MPPMSDEELKRMVDAKANWERLPSCDVDALLAEVMRLREIGRGVREALENYGADPSDLGDMPGTVTAVCRALRQLATERAAAETGRKDA